MIRVRFKTKKTLYNDSSHQEQYPANTGSEYFANEEFTERFDQEAPETQEYPQYCSCNICGGEIASNCLEVTFKQNRFHVHTSCIVSAFAVIMNGIGFLTDWLFKKKNNKNNFQ